MCGWKAAELNLAALPRELRIPDRGSSFTQLEFRKSGPGSLTVEVTLESDANWVTFDEAGTHQSFLFSLADQETSHSVKIYFHTERLLHQRPGLSETLITIHLKSDDSEASDYNKEYTEAKAQNRIYYRPWQVRQQRQKSIPIRVILQGPAELRVWQQAILFSRRDDAKFIRLENVGNSSLSLKRVVVPGGFQLWTAGRNSQAVEAHKITHTEIKAKSFIDWVVRPSAPLSASDTSIRVDAGNAGSKDVELLIDIRRRPAVGALSNYVVAIDFGTSKTAVALLDVTNNDVSLIDLEPGGFMPSCMLFFRNLQSTPGASFNPERVYYGSEAIAVYGPGLPPQMGTLIRSMKSALGQKESYRILDSRDMDAEEIVTDYLREVRSRIRAKVPANGGRRFVFSLPVLDIEEHDVDVPLIDSKYEKQQQLTLAAADTAGFKGDTETLLEPQCAALYIAYYRDKHHWGVQLQSDELFAVYDFGAGTLDITFAQYSLGEDGRPQVQIRGNIGRYFFPGQSHPASIGGDLVDRTIATFVIQRFSLTVTEPVHDQYQIIENAKWVGNRDVSWLAFLNEIRRVKEAFSDKSIDSEEVKGPWDTIRLYRKDFNEWVGPIIDASTAAMHRKLRDIPEELKYIFLVGGSSLMPIVEDRVKYEFSQVNVVAPPSKEHAVLAVVKGAALSYLVRVTNNLGYEVGLRRPGTDLPEHRIFPGNALLPRSEQLILPAEEAHGEWEIVFERNRVWYRSSYIKLPESPQLDDNIALQFHINEQRRIAISYSFTYVAHLNRSEPFVVAVI